MSKHAHQALGKKVQSWLSEPMPKDVLFAIHGLAELPIVHRIAVMPDVHLAGEFCNGTVVACKDWIMPQAVGSDIGCGMTSVRFDVEADALLDSQAAQRIFKGLRVLVPCNKHSSLTLVESLLEGLQTELTTPSLNKLKNRDGRAQLGTLGRGNHFLELQRDEQGRLWVTVHSGSRAMGQAIAKHHLSRAEAVGLTGSKYFGFPAAGEAGQAYLKDMSWARSYARQNRLAMIEAVTALLEQAFGANNEPNTLVDCDHNHAQKEMHEGVQLYIHRKGALPANTQDRGIIPGSMGTCTYHVRGLGHEGSLRSSSHGAGRAQSRSQAKQSIGVRQLRRELSGVYFDPALENFLREEAPSAYKDVRKVMKAQSDLVRIERKLYPLLVYKGK